MVWTLCYHLSRTLLGSYVKCSRLPLACFWKYACNFAPTFMPVHTFLWIICISLKPFKARAAFFIFFYQPLHYGFCASTIFIPAVCISSYQNDSLFIFRFSLYFLKTSPSQPFQYILHICILWLGKNSLFLMSIWSYFHSLIEESMKGCMLHF